MRICLMAGQFGEQFSLIFLPYKNKSPFLHISKLGSPFFFAISFLEVKVVLGEYSTDKCFQIKKTRLPEQENKKKKITPTD